MIDVKNLKTRDELPLLLNHLNLKGVGVEIGVQVGGYSETILSKSKLSKLYSVDCWKHFGGYEDIANKPQYKQYYYLLRTILRLWKFGKRSKIVRNFSEDAVKRVRNNYLDFVYIDAQHSYSGAKKDIEMWYPKVKSGGVFAGHDYVAGRFHEGNFDVKGAVDEFVKKSKDKLYITGEKEFPSWYIIKK